MNPLITVLLFVLVFPLFFLFIVWILAQFGWSRIAERYRYIENIRAQRVGLISFQLNRKVNYNNVTICYVDEDGFYLKSFFPFSIVLTPLFIPWRDVLTIESHRFLFAKTTTLTVGQHTSFSIQLKTATYEHMRSISREKNAKINGF